MIEKVCVVRTKSTHIPHKGLNKTLDQRTRKQGLVKPEHIETKEQPAHIFTKPLSSNQFATLLGKLGVINIHSNLKESIEGKNPE
jgi:hypothetical protein